MFILSYSIVILLMIALPVMVGVLLRRKVRVPWALFLMGALTFAGSQAVHLPLNNLLYRMGILPPTGTLAGPPLWRTALILGLTSGLCEELARTAGMAVLKKYRQFEHGLMLGIGHGGFEAMLFGAVLTASGISTLLSIRGEDLGLLGLSAVDMEAVLAQLELLNGSALLALVPLLERMLAMSAHVIFSMIVWQAFQRKNWLYVVLAVIYHAAINFSGVMLPQYTSVSAFWLISFAAMLIPGVVWLSLLGRKEFKPQPVQASFRLEFGVFLIAVKKELLQMWRTQRIIIVAAVFLVFGMMSPALAKFTPQILGSMEGAAMFADLIPEPTVADAMTQFIKNLTQFGFILVILMGMGAVAGEKEKGVAAIILSKPMPRWGFILSKFTAQALVYIVAMIAAGAGALGYTWMLFGAFDLGPFVLLTLLLLLWLLVFVAVTVLGSTVGGSMAAGAGIALGGAVLLLLAGYIPNVVGPLMPGGLVAWAGQLGAGTGAMPTMANGGAVAAALVLIVLLLIGAVAVFEKQEL